MKKIYESPKALFDLINTCDVITNSNLLSYNSMQNAELDQRDSRSFGSFFADQS